MKVRERPGTEPKIPGGQSGASGAAPSLPLPTRTLVGWSVLFGLLCFLLHLAFTFRYDIYLGSDLAIVYLIPKRILHGEYSIYLWGQRYMGLGPLDFLAAALFRVFGASIPLAGMVNLFAWSIGIGLLVAYVGRCFGKSAMIACGCALAVGVPYLIKFSTAFWGAQYNLATLYTGGFLWLAVLLQQRGGRSWLCALTGLIMGWHWYADKLVLSVWVSIAIAFVALSEGRAFLREFVHSRMAIFTVIAFLIGYSPELLYRMGVIPDSYGRVETPPEFFGLASPALMARNWYMLIRCIPTYFDADPLSRSPNGVHYLNHLENWESFPLSASDTIGLIAAFLVVSFLLRSAVEAYRRQDFKVFMLTLGPFVNALLILISARADGAYYGIRRYLFNAGLILVLWTGVLLAKSLEARKWAVGTLLILMFGFSAFHQVQMLQLPDELADYKKVVRDIERHGYKYGLTWYSYAHTLTALSNEKVVFGILDRKFQSPYQQTVLAQDVVAFVWPSSTPPPFEDAQKLFFGGVIMKSDSTPKSLPERLAVFGANYLRIGEPVREGELAWAPYRRLQ